MTTQWRPVEPAVRALVEQSDRTVPFVGAGLSWPCGLPRGDKLAELLTKADFATGVWFREPGALFPVVDDLEEAGVDADVIAKFVMAKYDLQTTGARPSAPILALARVPSRLIITLNYDRLFEAAAELQGLPFRSFTWENLPYDDDLASVPGELFVVHLHGIVGEQSGLVLNGRSYSAMSDNNTVRTWLRTVLGRYNLWFFGTQMDETYLQDTLQAARSRSREPRHVFVDHEPGVKDATTGRGQLTRVRHGVHAEALPVGRFDLLDEFCDFLVRPRMAADPAPVSTPTAGHGSAPAVGAAGVAAALVLTNFTGAKEWTHNALTELAQAHPEQAQLLRDALDVDDVATKVADLIGGPPDWLRDGPWQLWVAVARFAEQDGAWSLAVGAWETTSQRPGAEEVRWLVSAALAAGLAGDAGERSRLLAAAEAVDENHPRLRLERAGALDAPSEQLEAFAPLRDEPDDVGALANVHSAVAALVDADDFDAAEEFLARARELRPDMMQVRVVAANIAIHRGRIAVTSGSRINFPALRSARSDCLAVRDDLLQQHRFEESARLLMLAADATAISMDFDGAGELLQDATTDELAVPLSRQLLAESAMRAQLPGVADTLIDPTDTSEFGRRLRAQVDLDIGEPTEQLAALAVLDELIESSEEHRKHAALIRVSRTPQVPDAEWSEAAEQLLHRGGERKPALVFRALYLRERGKPEEGVALLQPFAGEKWAAEPLLDWATTDGEHQPAAKHAAALLAAGPGQGTRLRCALALGRAGDEPRARAELLAVAEDLTAAPPLRTEAYRHLVDTVVHTDRDFPEALRWLDAWKATDATDVRQLWTRAFVLHRLARHDEALQLLLDTEAEPRGVDDARLAAALYARLPDRIEAARRITALSDQFDAANEELERRAVLHLLHTMQDDTAMVPEDLAERLRLDRFVEKFPGSDIAQGAQGAVDFDQLKALIAQRVSAQERVWQLVEDGDAVTAKFAEVLNLDVGTTWVADALPAVRVRVRRPRRPRARRRAPRSELRGRHRLDRRVHHWATGNRGPRRCRGHDGRLLVHLAVHA